MICVFCNSSTEAAVAAKALAEQLTLAGLGAEAAAADPRDLAAGRGQTVEKHSAALSTAPAAPAGAL